MTDGSNVIVVVVGGVIALSSSAVSLRCRFHGILFAAREQAVVSRHSAVPLICRHLMPLLDAVIDAVIVAVI